MKNVMKYMLVALTAISFSVANAGELNITGDAKASYVITGSDGAKGGMNANKSLGVSNEFSLTASGELDNGWSWNYAQDIDGATVQDDGKLTMTMGGMGTLGVFISEGGLESINKSSQSVIARPSDTSLDENMLDNFNLSGFNTIQYHTPADLLPFGITAKVAYAPSTTAAANSYKAGGAQTSSGFTAATNSGASANPFAQTAAMGRSATHYRVDASPVDGLTVGADYVDFDKVNSTEQAPESGAYYATYAIGPATIGYARGYLATALGVATDVLESVDSRKYSIAANVNDNFSISYEDEESDPTLQTSSTATFPVESTGIQAAYTMGGMTLAVAMNDHQNVEYTDGKDVNETVISVAMAF
jgi:hypothetical protein